MKSGKLTIGNLTGGWSSDLTKGTASSPQTKANTYFSGLVNLNLPNYLGQIANHFGQNPGTLGMASLPIDATIDSNGYGYFILENGTLSFVALQLLFPPNPPINYTAPPGCMTNSNKGIWNHVYTDGTESIFYTYETATNAYLGYISVATPSTPHYTYKTLTNIGVPHPGVVSVANKSYIADGNLLQAYDPNTGNMQAINVGKGYVIQSVADYGNYVAAVGHNGTKARMWLWNGTTPDANFQYDIRDTYATCIVNEGGQLRVFTSGKNDTTKIKTFDGSGFSEEADWETPTSLCTTPLHGMADVWLNQVVWRTQDGYVWTYGSVRKNELQSGAHRAGLLTTDTFTKGCVRNLIGNKLHVGIKNGGTNYLYEVKADASYGSGLTSTLKTSLYALPHYATITKISVYFSNYRILLNGNSSTFNLSLYKDYDTTTDMLNYTLPNNLATEDQYVYYHPIKATVTNVDSFYMKINFYGCIIRKIEVDYSFDDTI